MKRLLTLTAFLMLTVVSFAYDAKIDGIYYDFSSKGEATVTYLTPNEFNAKAYTGSVVIPASVTYSGKTYSVTSIGKEAFSLCSVTSVIIPNSVTSIDDYAFYDCEHLTSVTIPNSVTSIGKSAFEWCRALTSVTIGNSVTSIGSYAFHGCTGLTSVTIPNSVTSIGNDAFSSCSGLTFVTISESVTSIGSYAFSYCKGLTSVTIPNSVTSIGTVAFNNCSGLTSVTIGNSVTNIGEDAFTCCSSLNSIKVASGNTKYDSRENCNAIIETASNTLITGCKNTEIPRSVTSIGKYAFYGCTDLISVTIPESVTKIGDWTFRFCSGLKKVIIPNSVTSIGGWTFSDCNSLTDIFCYAQTPPSISSGTFSEYLATLHVVDRDVYESAEYWKNFTNIVLDPDLSRAMSLTVDDIIAYVAEDETTGKTLFTIEGVPFTMNSNEVDGYGSLRVTFNNETGGNWTEGREDWVSNPQNKAIKFNIRTQVKKNTTIDFVFPYSGRLYIYGYGSSNNDFVQEGQDVQELTIASAKQKIPTVEDKSVLKTAYVSNMLRVIKGRGTLKIDENNSLYFYGFCFVPDSYEAIIDGICYTVNSATKEATVVSYYKTSSSKKNADTGMANLVIPSTISYEGITYSVTAIGNYAFSDCTDIVSVTIPGSVSTIGSYAFSDCTDIASVTIGDDVTSIDTNSFNGTSSSIKFYVDKDAVTLLSLWNSYLGNSRYSKDYIYDINTGKKVEMFETTASSVRVRNLESKKKNYTITSQTLTINGENADLPYYAKGLSPQTLLGTVLLTIGYEYNGESRTFSTTSDVTTDDLTLTNSPVKVVSIGNVVVSAETNVDENEENVGFEWRRTDWPEDIASNTGKAAVYEGTMEGCIRNLNTGAFWRVRPYYLSDSGTYYYGDWVGIDPSNTSYFEPTVHTYADIAMDGRTALVKGYALNGTDGITVQGFKYWKSVSKANSLGFETTDVTTVPSDAKTVEATGQVMTASLTGLDYDSEYSIVAFVTTTTGETFYGEERKFTTETGPTGVVAVEEDNAASSATVTAIYDANARRIAQPQRGLNILKMSDGTSRKIVVQ